MMLGPFYYKRKAKEALKGNWQTAMVVAFFSGIFMTVVEVFQAICIPLYLYTDGQQMYFAMGQVADYTWWIYGGLMFLAVIATPVLDLGCDFYFIKRLRGEELGAAGLWSRLRVFAKALWLYVNIGVRVVLWGMLLIVPGILAALRYSLATYYLAEHPEMTASEAIEASKAAMKNQKGSLFALMVSFFLWILLSNFAQLALESVNGILATAAGLFLRVWISAYTNASVASFYVTASNQTEQARAQREMRGIMTDMGVDLSALDKKGKESGKQADPEDEPKTKPSNEDGGGDKD